MVLVGETLYWVSEWVWVSLGDRERMRVYGALFWLGWDVWGWVGHYFEGMVGGWENILGKYFWLVGSGGVGRGGCGRAGGGCKCIWYEI